MPCYRPLKGWYAKKRNASGKKSIVFKTREGHYDRPVVLPCGQCIGCRLEKSRQWAIRCVHESEMFEKNCFITLTYRDVQENSSLVKRDFVLFMKKLRKKYGCGIRFYMCGEYGERLKRPHFHACLFNHDFEDKIQWSIKEGIKLYRSEELEKLWGHGYSTIGDVTFESSAYVARYIMKKITGKEAEGHYEGRQKEYTTMSRRPGIGRSWFDVYWSDCYPSDEVVVREGLKCKPPKYYDNVYDDLTFENKVSIIDIKARRKEKLKPEEYREKRLAQKGKYKVKQFERLVRNYEKKCV